MTSTDKQAERQPVISVTVQHATEDDREKMGIALRQLLHEDPTFDVSSEPNTGQTVIRGMGELHLEIILDRLNREFNIRPSTVGRPQIVYHNASREVGHETETVLLEPLMALEVFLFGDDLASLVTADLSSRRGRIDAVEHRGSNRIIKAVVPLAEMLGYAAHLRRETDGRASYSMQFARYDEVSPGK
jgi:translation elongation factor EF-G